jgi:hypothetical protein
MKKPILVAAMLLSAFAHSQALTPDDEQMLNEDAVEAAYLSAADSVTRQGNLLSIKTSSGTIEFKNQLEGHEGYTKSMLAGVFKLGRERTDYIVRHDGNDRREYTLINGQTGKQATLQSLPMLSPGRLRYLAAQMYEEINYSSGGLSIIRAKDFSAEKEIVLQPAATETVVGASSALWVSETKVFFLRQALDKNLQSVEPRIMILEHIGKDWNEPREIK